VSTLQLLALCALAVRVVHRYRPPALPKGPGGRPRVTLTYAAAIVVVLAVHQAGRPDPIRPPKRVLAHCWEGLV